jgi:hypothetical protein
MKVLGHISGGERKLSPDLVKRISEYEDTTGDYSGEEPTEEPEKGEKFNVNELGGVAGEKIRQEIIPNIGDLGGVFGQRLMQGSGKPPVEYSPSSYTPPKYVGIFDSYEPLPKDGGKLNYKPLEFTEHKYEPYVHEQAPYEPMKFMAEDYKPEAWIPSEWTTSEYDELKYKPMDNSQPPYVSPIIDPAHYEPLPYEPTEWSKQGQTWQSSPLWQSSKDEAIVTSNLDVSEENHNPVTDKTGMGELLLGNLENTEPLVETGMGEQLFGSGKDIDPTKETGMLSNLFGSDGEQGKPWEVSPVFQPTGLGEALFGTTKNELPIQPTPTPTPTEPTPTPTVTPTLIAPVQPVSNLIPRKIRKRPPIKGRYNANGVYEPSVAVSKLVSQ